MCYMGCRGDRCHPARSPTARNLEGQRDHALLAVPLQHTGARIQEALDVCPPGYPLRIPRSGRVAGQGAQESKSARYGPETVDVLKALLRRQTARANDEPIFVNRYGEPLGAAGRFASKLKQYVSGLPPGAYPSLATKRITPPHLAPVCLATD